MGDTDKTDETGGEGTPPSDLYANPQDTAGGRAAARDQERVDRGEQPAHAGDDKPRPGGKAETDERSG